MKTIADILKSGHELLGENRFIEALRTFDTLLQNSPRNVQALFGKALAQVGIGMAQKNNNEMGNAIQNLESVLFLAPDFLQAKELLSSLKQVGAQSMSQYLKMGPLVEVLREIEAAYGKEELSCLEIGTIRSYEEKHESTRHIAEIIAGHGRLVSIDTSAKSIAISKEICRQLSNITWANMDGLSYLKQALGKNQTFHFILLDGANDKDITFQEFRIAVKLLKQNGAIIIDDAGVNIDHTLPDKTAPLAEKGAMVFSFLKAHNIDFTVLQTIQGTQMLIWKRWKQPVENLVDTWLP